MEFVMEIILTAVAIPTIVAILYWIGYLRERTATSKEERRNIDRRVGKLEEDVSLLKKVLITLENLKVNIGYILENQTKTNEKLEKMSEWQAKHQPIIEEAKQFIHEANRDGVRSKT